MILLLPHHPLTFGPEKIVFTVLLQFNACQDQNLHYGTVLYSKFPFRRHCRASFGNAQR